MNFNPTQKQRDFYTNIVREKFQVPFNMTRNANGIWEYIPRKDEHGAPNRTEIILTDLYYKS